MISRLLVAASIALALSAVAADRVRATQAWARATPPGATVGAAYVSIDGGAVADRLVEAHVDGAARVEFHEARNDDGIARMRPLAAVDVPAGARVVFAPNGLTAVTAQNQSTTSYVRGALGGTGVRFLASDWTTGPKTH